MTNLQKIKEACIKANPYDLGVASNCTDCGYQLCICEKRDTTLGWGHKRRFGLADVLLAIQQVNGINNVAVEEYGVFMQTDEEGWGEIHDNDKRVKWNLKNDNLDHQSKDCLQFLSNLLC